MIAAVYKNSPVLFEIVISLPYQRKWLGTKSSYYHPQTSHMKYKSLLSFQYTGGLILEDFILGINNTTKQFIYNTKSLQEDDVTRLEGPLLNSKLYQRFIDSGKNPIEIYNIYTRN